MFSSVHADEMAYALTLFVSAANGRMSTGHKPVSFESRTEAERFFTSFSNAPQKPSRTELFEAFQTPLFQAYLIVWEHYRGDPLQNSICSRLLGFYHLTTRRDVSEIAPWLSPVEEAPEQVLLHPALVETLANVRLGPDGKLDERGFLLSIEATSRQFTHGPTAEPTDTPWPAYTGEMASLVREHDWHSSGLAETRLWPQSLKTAVDLALGCRFPMIVLWGPELIQIYNQGYRVIMGDKHPAGLGQATRQCWPEVWHINEPIYARVFLGETVTMEDGLFPIERNGRFEDAFFTLCYSPLRDEAGKIHGILVTVFETTERVINERRRDQPGPAGDVRNAITGSGLEAGQWLSSPE